MTQSQIRHDGGREQDVGQMQGDLGEWGVKEMSKRYIPRSFQCLSTHDNEVGQCMFLKAESVVSGCCNDDRFMRKALIFSLTVYFSRVILPKHIFT